MALTSRLTEGAFVSSRQGAWGELAHLSQRAADVGRRRLAPADLARLSPGYRDACADLAHARAARYSAPLVEQLVLLAAQAPSTLSAGLRSPRRRGSLGCARSRPRGWRWTIPRSSETPLQRWACRGRGKTFGSLL